MIVCGSDLLTVFFLIMLKNWQFPRRWWTFDSYVMQPCKPLTKEKKPKCYNWVFRVSCTYSDHGHTHIRVRVQYSECCYCRVVKLVHSCVVKFACCGCCSWSWPSIKSVSYLITVVYYMFDHQLGDRKKKTWSFLFSVINNETTWNINEVPSDDDNENL